MVHTEGGITELKSEWLNLSGGVLRTFGYCSSFLACGVCLGQTGGNDGIHRRIEGQPDVRARNPEVCLGRPVLPIAPVHNPVRLRVDRSFCHRGGHRAAERLQEIASAVPRVAIGKHSRAVFRQDAASNHLGRAQNAGMGHGTAKGRSQRDYGSHVGGPLGCERAGDNFLPDCGQSDELSAPDFASAFSMSS